MTKRDNSVANLKGILLLGIFFYHSISALAYVRGPQSLPLSVQLPLTMFFSRTLGTFFLISGYFAWPDEGEISLSRWGSFLKKRISGLVVPYLLWNGIYIVIFLFAGLFLPVIARRVQELNLHSIRGILGSEIGIWARPADGPLWFLRDLFFLVIPAPLFAWLARKRRGEFLLLVALLGFWWMPRLRLIWGWLPFQAYGLLAFCLGMWMRQQKISLHIFEKHGVLAFAMVVLCLLSLFNVLPVSSCYFSLFQEGQYIILIPACLYSLKFLHKDMSHWLYRYVAEPSFFVFASHALVASMIVRLLCPLIPSLPVNGILFAFLYFAGGGGIVYVCWWLAKRFCFPVYSVLIGHR